MPRRRYSRRRASGHRPPSLMFCQQKTPRTQRKDIETVKIGQKLGAIGIKDSSGDMFYQTNLIEEFKNIPEFAIITGTELFIPETILQGGHGAIAGGANIYPKLFVEMYDASIARDFEKIAILRELNIQLYNTIYAVSSRKDTIITKTTMLGIDNGGTRVTLV